jgi:disulfide bond formation protein DsbB
LLPFVWKGIYWPGQTGWQEQPRINETAGNWYVYKKGDWQALIDQKNAAATEKYAASHPVLMNKETKATGVMQVNMQLYLLLVFLAACIFLWVEQKLG